MAYTLTLQTVMAILRFTAHHITVTSTSSGSYSNMGRPSVYKMRIARRHYIWHHLVGRSMLHVYCLTMAQTYMRRTRTEGLRCTKRHARIGIGAPLTKCHLRRKLTWYACCLSVAQLQMPRAVMGGPHCTLRHLKGELRSFGYCLTMVRTQTRR